MYQPEGLRGIPHGGGTILVAFGVGALPSCFQFILSFCAGFLEGPLRCWLIVPWNFEVGQEPIATSWPNLKGASVGLRGI